MSADNWADCPWCGRNETWREDYTTGMSEGVFKVEYYGQCVNQECRKKFTHKHTEVVVPDMKKRKAERQMQATKEEMDRLQRIIDGTDD